MLTNQLYKAVQKNNTFKSKTIAELRNLDAVKFSLRIITDCGKTGNRKRKIYTNQYATFEKGFTVRDVSQ